MQRPDCPLANRSRYARHFSNARYQQALLAILREGTRMACLLAALWNGAAAVVPLAGLA